MDARTRSGAERFRNGPEGSEPRFLERTTPADLHALHALKV
jgi:hypothetical protein